ncbi:MBL fold metallo-hydrolase [Luteimonas sp. 50]|uniref:MBL fold metallo-hydrolase n=1 Tax=Cognatiluteimonas sedimenti TaxID=2927791 RepID=A0ABT0A0L3_9GAMM|nr:MBL fold metallo-hydrolase [Lysobacter sedimenti]MCJ0824514.1 MBL fold metallo-hydrolase [Lysobacter sedimenti]
MHRALTPWMLLLSLLLPIAGHAQAPPAEPDVRVVLLGTAGGPVVRPDRVGIGTLVLAGDQVLLFDVGRGVPTALRAMPEDPGIVTATFLTHLHSDHLVGLPELYLFPWASQGRRTPFRILGPAGTRAMMAHLQAAFAFDIHVRRDIDEHFPGEGIAVDATDIQPGVVYDTNGVKVTAFLVDHAPVEPAYGFRVDYRGRSVVLSGDTRPSPNLAAFAKGADLLIHEVGRWKGDPALAGDPAAPMPNALTRGQMRGIAEHHTDPVEAGVIFAEARPKLAVFSHYARAGDDLLPLVRRHYPGRVEVGRDGMVIEIGEQVRIRAD